MLNNYLRIGQVIRPHGVRGEVKVMPDTDDLSHLRALSCVYTLRQGTYEEHSIENIVLRDGFFTCRLDACATREHAETYRNTVLYVDRAHAMPLKENQFYIQDLIGCKVCTQGGNHLGAIEDVLQNKGNDVLCIRQPAGGSVYMPFIQRLLCDVRLEEGLLVVDESVVNEVAVFED